MTWKHKGGGRFDVYKKEPDFPWWIVVVLVIIGIVLVAG